MKKVYEGILAPHDRAPFRGQVVIDLERGHIEEVVEQNTAFKTPDHVFSDDCFIFAGMGDLHIHAREDETGEQMHKEMYQCAADAALSGGCVHVSAMPNTPAPVTTNERYAWHRARIAEIKHPVSILNYIGIDSSTSPLGAPGEHFYKLYFGKSVGDLTVTYASELDAILSRYRGHHVSFHVEYEPIVQASAGGRTHSDRRPVPCVNEGLRLLLPIIEKYEIKTKLCHWSTGGESFELIQAYRDRGCDITLEVSPLHLLFDTSMTDADPSLWLKVQMNPAIQSPEHRAALIQGLKEGFIQYLATDHAPHTEEEKYQAFAKYKDEFPGKTNIEIAQALAEKDKERYLATCVENGMSGAPWLDTYGLVCSWLMSEHGFTPQDIARVASYNPGQFVNPHLPRQFPTTDFGKGFGELKAGYVGSLTILNTKKQTTVERTNLKTKCGWSPLEGRTAPGAVEAVVVRGELISR